MPKWYSPLRANNDAKFLCISHKQVSLFYLDTDLFDCNVKKYERAFLKLDLHFEVSKTFSNLGQFLKIRNKTRNVIVRSVIKFS